ncbi:MAG TPA: glycogen debranching protein GlgX [Fibrobacteria bacterium]|nr:glycogen debranching protein GlgX [Fibrobacteria bacterium]
MSSKNKNVLRNRSKDGTYVTIEAYRKKAQKTKGIRPKFKQPERKVVQRVTHTVQNGLPYPLGATVTPTGINFAVHSRYAQEMFLVLFDSPGGEPTDVIPLPGRTGFVHHGFVGGLRHGQLYAFRARGEFNPAMGLRFNESKLLLDPYARAFAGAFKPEGNILLAYDPLNPERDLSVDERDNTMAMPKCMAYSKPFDWEGDKPLEIPMAELIVYEVHLKGFTANPNSGVSRPGTYLGFIEKIPYLKKLGVNAVELLPIHAKYPEDHLSEKCLNNYWGYNTFGFFAPEASYRGGKHPGDEVEEFKTLVKALHKAGIEVILDVVYNHTCEGNELGPTVSFKGLDNPAYYALTGADGAQALRYYHNYTGTGNTLDFGSPVVVRLAMDSLRYWVEEMHVDGFRFDLALVLGRGHWNGFDPRAPIFQAIMQDPVLNRVKLIAEPWDCAGYEVGNFPVNWAEWNGKFRDTVRRFVKGDDGQLNELGWRVTGSADLYAEGGRTSDASINFVTCHDGFTLNDLVSYNHKHNEANLEENRDGSNDNASWNCGVEGETADELVTHLRRRQVKNFVCLMFFSQGVPMISHGDEILRTQKGNNNVYCQDNPLAWMDWSLEKENADVFLFFRKAIALRKRMPLLLGKRFLTGRDTDMNEVPDITWYGPDGGPVDWNNPLAKQIAFQLDGYDGVEDEEGPRVRELSRFYLILNASFEETDFRLPPLLETHAWHRVADTGMLHGKDFLDPGRSEPLKDPLSYRTKAHTVVILVNRLRSA